MRYRKRYTKSDHEGQKATFQYVLDKLLEAASAHGLMPDSKMDLIGLTPEGIVLEVAHLTTPDTEQNFFRVNLMLVTVISIFYYVESGQVVDSCRFDEEGNIIGGNIRCNYDDQLDLDKLGLLIKSTEGKWQLFSPDMREMKVAAVRRTR